MRMQTPPSPSKTNPVWDCFRNSKPLFETQDLLEWPLSACRRRYRIGCRRSRGVPVTQTQSPTKSFKPQPTSKPCPSPAIPYSFVAPLYFSYPTQLFRSDFAQWSSFKSPLSIRRAQIAGFRQTRQPNRIGSLCLCSGGRQKAESLRNRTPPCYLPIKPTGATRGKMRNQSLKRNPHAHYPNPNPFQKACLVTQRSRSCNYTTTARLLIGPSAALSRAPLTYTIKRFDPGARRGYPVTPG